MQVTGTIVQSNLLELLKTQFLLSPFFCHSIPSILGENLFLEFEIVHQVLNISKKLATSLRFGKQIRAAVIVVSCITSSANGTFSLPGENLLTISQNTR